MSRFIVGEDRQQVNVLAFNFKRILSILGFEGMMRAMRLVGA